MTRTREAMPAGIHHLNDERYVRVRRPPIANVHVRARTRMRPCALARRTARAASLSLQLRGEGRCSKLDSDVGVSRGEGAMQTM